MALVLASCNQQSDEAEGSGIFNDLSAGVAETCEGGGIVTGDEVAVSGDTPLLSTPGKDAEKVINQKATDIMGHTEHQSLDATEKLKELCRQKEWSKVQVVEPDWLTDVVGWVPVSALRSIEKDSSGKRTYVEADFYWDKDTSAYKPQIVANVNKIVRENDRCVSIDPGSVSKSGDRSAPGKPVFFVMCNNPAGVFNVWFEPGDAKAGKVFQSLKNIGQGEAVLACERAAKQAANNPQTVDFSTFMDVAFVPYPNGNSRLISSFTAKNAFGVEGKFRIECFFEGKSLTEQNISASIE